MILVIPYSIGNADTNIPYLWFLGAPHSTADRPSLLRVFNLRHVRFLTAQVEEQLQHGGEGFPVFFPAADVTVSRLP